MSDTEEQVSVAEMDRLLERMFVLDAAIDQQKLKTSDLNKQLATLEAEAVEKMKALGRKTYQSPHGSLQRRQMWRFSLPQGEDAKREMFKHFQDQGESVFLKFATVNSNSYSAYCKAAWEEAQSQGNGMEYKGPGGTEPKLHETVAMVKKK